MEVLKQLEGFKSTSTPLILTIGNFDGIHRGHQTILQKVLQLADGKAPTAVITFSNHPSEILRPMHATLQICTLVHRLLLMEYSGIDMTIVLPFTPQLAQQNADIFIKYLQQFFTFSHLVLGYDATLGKDRQGDRAVIHRLGQELGFQVYYLEEYCHEGLSVSSTRIRKSIMEGNFKEVELLLQRPYSIYGDVCNGLGQGKQIGYATANLNVSKLCLPPFGVYAVEVYYQKKKYGGIANLGFAPTLQMRTEPTLEVHIFDQNQNLYGSCLEVVFKKFIRTEQKFEHAEHLQQQIAKDIHFVKTYFS